MAAGLLRPVPTTDPAAAVRRARAPAPAWLLPWLLLVAMPAANAAPTAACARAPSQYRVQVWQQRDGLPQDAVMALAQTPDGFVWIGMEDGLARFDGTTFESIDLRPAVGTASEYINALEVGPDARLYVGTGSSGVLGIDGGARPGRASSGHWPRQPVQALLVHAGQRWAGLRGGGLVDFRGATPRVIGPDQGLGGPGVTALAPRLQGGIWIGLGAGGVQWYDGRAFHRLPQLQALGEIHVEDLLEDSAGILWLATRSGLFRVSGNDVRRYGPQDGLRSDVIKSLLQDRNGQLWVGTAGEGVGRLCGDRFDFVGAEQGLPAAPIIDMVEDAEGAIWVAGGGLVRLSTGPALPITVHQGLPDKPILPILQDRRGAMWIGTFGGGLVHWTPERVRTITTADGLSSEFVLALAQGPGDTVWAGTRNGVNLLRDGRVVRGRVLSTPTVMSLLHDGRRLWIGTVDGLASLAEGAAVVEPVPGGRFGAIVVMLFRDARGVLWIGTDGAGLFRLRDGVITPAPFAAQLSTNAVFAMLETRPGVLWMATGRGLARWDGRQLRTVSSLHGLPGDNLFSLLADASGRVWASSNRGVFAVPLEELEKIASGQGRIGTARLFTEVDGMPVAETNGGFQPAAWRDAQGRHWYGTREGVAVFDPARLPPREAPPRVMLRRVLVDQRALAPGPRIAVGPDPGLIEIGYVAPAFSQPQALEYQYRLNGFDDGWYAARAARTAVYRQLPPGRFRFEVRARYASGPWSDPASMDLQVEPALAERWWFRASLVLLLLFALAALLHQWVRTRDAKRRQLQQVQKLESIGQLTGGIAHDFNNVLAAIVQSSDALASALPRNHPLQAATMEILRAADLGGSLTRQLLAFARREETQPRWIDLAAEVAEMEAFLRRLLPDSIQIESRYDPVGACLIDPVHLQQIVLNLVLNARDAMPEGGRLRIAVSAAATGAVAPLLSAPDRSHARLSVEDTGTGMSAAVRERIFEPFFTTKPRDNGTGLGLAVTYGIVRKAGGTIVVDAEPGSGAAFHVYLPVESIHAPHALLPEPAGGAGPRAAAPSTAAAAPAGPVPPVRPVAALDAGEADRGVDRLLILDDDPAIAASVARAAAGDRFAVRIAETPAHFFELVDAWKPSHVIIDLVMPLMDGVEVLRMLADSGYPGRIVLMSGMGSKVLEAARRSGAAHGLEVAGVLDKPFRAGCLRNVLRGPAVPAQAAPAHAVMDQRLLLEQDLADALARNEFVQAYQPEIDLASGRVVGFESLVRWRHPVRGMVYPDQFIPLAERCGRIDALTFHVIRSSLAWLAGLPAHSTAGVSINLSARSLSDISIYDVLQEQCEHWELPPARITLELTETSAMLDAVDALDTLTRLRLRGYGLAIDDFGTGYSSMLQLARLPFSQLKIDKSFVMSMGESAESRKIVESTISLGRALSLVTVAEGVEDAATLEALRELGCDRAQGYHIARPMDGEAARRWYLDSEAADDPGAGARPA